MIYLDVCGLCKNYYGYIDGKTKCKTYPDGQPTGFCSSKDEKCNGDIGLEVKDEMKEHSINYSNEKCKERPKGGAFLMRKSGR